MGAASFNYWILLTTALISLTALQATLAEVVMSLPAQLEAEIDGSIQLPCTHQVTGTTSNHIVEWFVEVKNGLRERIAFRDLTSSKIDVHTDYTDRIIVQPDYTLTVSNVRLIDERIFYCQVTAGSSGSGVGMTNLKVYAVPDKLEITNKKEDLVVTAHATPLEIATCTVKNVYPTQQIIWYKNGLQLETVTERNDDMYMAPHTLREPSGLFTVSSTLFMKIFRKDNDSTFHCSVIYETPKRKILILNSTMVHRNIHYYTEEVTFELMQPKVIKEGDKVTMKCTADGHPVPEFQLSKLQHGEEKEIPFSSNGIYVFKSIRRKDSGTYRCEALDFDSPDEINLKRDLVITVNYLDSVIVHPSGTVTVSLGETKEVTCTATGSQEPKIMWLKNGKPVSDTQILSLKEVDYNSQGTYTCEASIPSVPGLVKTNNTVITVTGKPAMEDLKSEYDIEHNKATLTCSAVGNPLPIITWSIPKLKPMDSQSENRVTSTLLIEITKELSESTVQCTAKNEVGSSMKTIQLIKLPEKEMTAGTGDADHQTGTGSSVAVIAVVVSVVLLLVIVGLLYFLHKSKKLPCGRQEKSSLTTAEGKTEDIVVEMKNDRPNEEAGLLGAKSGKQ
ncbi:basal cell adhesion molecule isoform X2 [Protopterus annectens]|uniref:basal cell adhesion molecule isoform X2 n=1 Tax=Protopterus annectens TaxID=7888 RepID=UPI001CFA3666|nr:basal cell adhesion molecule isoform X2 [Protopterus annectens]